MTSIRLFLVIILIAIVTLANFFAALRGYMGSMDEADRLFNQHLLQQAELLNAFLPSHSYHSGSENNTQNTLPEIVFSLPETANNDQHLLEFQLIDDGGKVIARSAGIPNRPVAELNPGYSLLNFNNYRWNVLVHRAKSQPVWIVVAERNDQRYRLAESMILQAVYPMVVAIPLIGLIIWLVVGFGLRPIKWLAKEFHQREANDLSQIETNQMPDELQQLTQSANELLRRLEASFDREKRFSSDAAHELRTPISALKIHCENLLLESVQPSASLLKLQQGIDRMSYLVEQILSLNRMSPDHFMGTFSRLNLTALLKNQVAEHSLALAGRQHTIEFEGDECWIYGDRLALETLISNLLSNAIKYTSVGGRIAVGTWLRGEEVVLEVMDNGPGIDESLSERVFDRFYRLGGDRNNTAVQGCGLGLSIVRQIVELHRARIKLTHSRFSSGLLAMVIFSASNMVDADYAKNHASHIEKKSADENA